MAQTTEFTTPKTRLLDYPAVVLLRDVLKRWLVILAAAVIAGTCVYIYTDNTYTPVYQTNATLVVTTRDSSTTVYSNLQSTTNLASVFTELLNSSVLQKKIMEELNTPVADYSITASAIAETNLLTLQVTARDPRTAFLVIRSVIDNHGIITYEVIGNVVIEELQLPQVPTKPVNAPDALQRVQLAMVVAAVAAVVCLLMASYFSDTVRSRQEAERKLHCWCLGEVHHERKHRTPFDRLLRRKRGLTINNPTSSFHFVETIHKLRRRIEQYMAGGKVLMVTSVLENEGKSTIAVNAALSLAQKHGRVLLIDLDLRKPACHKILELTGTGPTVRDVLTGGAPLEEAIERDPLSGLYLLTDHNMDKKAQRRDRKVKNAKHAGSNLLTSESFTEMLRQVRGRYDYVVLDLPPMSAVPDSEYVLEHADAVLLVVQQNTVRATALNKAVYQLQRGNAKLLGCVLNNVYSSKLSLRGYGYGYGYGYGHSYGYGYRKYGAYGNYKKSGSSSSGKRTT